MSESETPASPTIYTPTTTAAPSVIGEKPHAKLSLAVRKNGMTVLPKLDTTIRLGSKKANERLIGNTST